MSAAKQKNKSLAFHLKEQRSIAKILLALGLLFMTAAVQWQAHEKTKLSFASGPLSEYSVSSKRPKPTFLTIPKISLALPIDQTQIQDNIWEISLVGASHLTSSANPGDSDTIIIYSHNTPDRFGPIRWLNHGEVIRIITEDGKAHDYKVSETMMVKPTDVDVLFSPRTEMLILYTCDGFADSMRFVLKAVPVQNS